jgi:hypothetical protein
MVPSSRSSIALERCATTGVLVLAEFVTNALSTSYAAVRTPLSCSGLFVDQ